MDLGVYLGVLLVHGRIRTRYYQYLIESAEKQLAGWKIRLLGTSLFYSCVPAGVCHADGGGAKNNCGTTRETLQAVVFGRGKRATKASHDCMGEDM